MENLLKIGFIINPISGTKSKADVPNLIDCLLDKNRFEYTIEYTERAGHAPEIARRMADEGYAVVVAVGGDGTVNEVARSLVHTNTALGILPFGSGNGLARHLEIPLNTSQAIAMLNNYRIAEIDYGIANDILFFCTCGVGFDAHIGHQFAIAEKRGFFTYFKSTVREFIKYKPKKYKFKSGETKFKRRAFLVTFANAAQYGNNAYIAPKADIQDGKLDVATLAPFPIRNVLYLAWKLFSKRFDDSQYVEIFKADEVRIKRKKKDIFHFDGEPMIMKKKIVVKSVHKGLKVAVRPNSSLQLL